MMKGSYWRRIYRNQEAEIRPIPMDLFESVGSADVLSDITWTKDMLNKPISLQPPKLAFSGESRYLTPLWVSGNVDQREVLPQSDLFQSTITGFELRSDTIGPDSDRIRDKISAAMKLLTFREHHVLVQFWSPHVIGKEQLLTTIDQPYGLGVMDERLLLYRKDSERNVLVADDNPEEKYLDPPARVFTRGLPEWTYDLTNYLPKDFSQQEHAIRCNLHGYLALPIFDSTTRSCVGVLEFLASSKYMSYAYEVQQVHSALKVSRLWRQKYKINKLILYVGDNNMAYNDYQTQNLTCQQVFGCPASNVSNERKQNELLEIFGILKSVCDTHNLPLAQTWVVSPSTSFVSHDKVIEKSCSSFHTRCIGKVCMSTTALPFYVRDLGMWPFKEACKEQHLDKSRGFVGKALLVHGSSYCQDVTQLSEEEYPLVHNAHMSGLTSCFAIYLYSDEGNEDYVLNFFLPSGMEDGRHVQNLVQTLKQKFESTSGFELGDTLSIQEVGDLSDSESIVTDVSITDPVNVPDQSSSTNVNMEQTWATSIPLKQGRKRKIESDTVTVEVTYEGCMTSFQFPISLGLSILENEVALRLKLEGKSLHLKYRDEEDDLILVCCDDDLVSALVTLGSNIMSLICLTRDG